MKKWFLSILSEKNGKGSAKRFAGLFASVIFFEVIQIIVICTITTNKDLPNQILLLKILEYNFIIIAAALVGIAASTLAGIIKGTFSFLPEDQNTEKND